MKSVVEDLRGIGKKLVDDFKNNKTPKIKVPSRYTSNIVFDPKYRCYVLGDKLKVRTATNIRHIKKIAQLLKVARYSKEDLISKDKHSTLRELYYYSENWGDLKFEDQQSSNDMIEDLEAMLGVPREFLRIIPEEKGAVYGDMVIEYKDPRGKIRRINCLDSPEGMAVGPKLDESKILKVNAKRVIAIESGGAYSRLVEGGAFDKFNSLLVHMGGQSTRSVRLLLKRLSEEFKLPIYLLTDADPAGVHIAICVISGSANLAHINKRLAVPDAKWLGVTAGDILKYELRTDKMTQWDIKRAKELLKDPRYQDEYLQRELKLFLKLKRKSEIQALAKHGLEYIIDEYLPAKLKQFES